MKEGKRRFLDLAPGRITELDTNFKPKRVVALESASVSVIGASSGCCVSDLCMCVCRI